MFDYRDRWLENLAREMATPAMKFDNDGLCQFMMNADFAITLFKSSALNALVIFGQLSANLLSPDLMRKMLVENRNSARSKSPIISLSDNEDIIGVHLCLNEEDLNSTNLGLHTVVAVLENLKLHV